MRDGIPNFTTPLLDLSHIEDRWKHQSEDNEEYKQPLINIARVKKSTCVAEDFSFFNCHAHFEDMFNKAHRSEAIQILLQKTLTIYSHLQFDEGVFSKKGKDVSDYIDMYFSDYERAIEEKMNTENEEFLATHMFPINNMQYSHLQGAKNTRASYNCDLRRFYLRRNSGNP